MNRKKLAILAGIFTVLFLAWTIVLLKVDVANDPVTLKDIGLSSVNFKMRDFLGANEKLDQISTIVMLLGFVFVFAAFVLWLIQIFKTRSFTGVDCELYAFGGITIACGICYVVFEIFIVNYRPVVLNGVAEASYPSSHILFIITLIGCAMLFIRSRIQSSVASRAITVLLVLVMIVGIVSRPFSGKHWFTDCVGALLLGTALVFWYETMSCECKGRFHAKLPQNGFDASQEAVVEDAQSDYQRQVRDYGRDDNWRDSFTPSK